MTMSFSYSKPKRKGKCKQCDNPMLKGIHTCSKKQGCRRWTNPLDYVDKEDAGFSKESKTMHVASIYQDIKETLNNSEELDLSRGQAEAIADLLSKRLGSTRLERI